MPRHTPSPPPPTIKRKQQSHTTTTSLLLTYFPSEPVLVLFTQGYCPPPPPLHTYNYFLYSPHLDPTKGTSRRSLLTFILLGHRLSLLNNHIFIRSIHSLITSVSQFSASSWYPPWLTLNNSGIPDLTKRRTSYERSELRYLARRELGFVGFAVFFFFFF